VLDAKVSAAGKMDEIKAKVAIAAQQSQDAAADREAKMRLAAMDLAKTLAVHPNSEGVVDQTLRRTI
jgi:hypothetical protein